MTSSKRIIEYHISRLQDKSVEVRLKAIRELELLQAREALEPLQALFQNDPDLEVRRAAQQAGRVIFRKHQANGR